MYFFCGLGYGMLMFKEEVSFCLRGALGSDLYTSEVT